MHLSRRKTAFGPSDAVVGEKTLVFGLGQGTQTPEGRSGPFRGGPGDGEALGGARRGPGEEEA
jgi:hypothetical protein